MLLLVHPGNRAQLSPLHGASQGIGRPGILGKVLGEKVAGGGLVSHDPPLDAVPPAPEVEKAGTRSAAAVEEIRRRDGQAVRLYRPLCRAVP